MTAQATSKDVAKLAGVSQATVSYVLNNTKGKHISEGTRQSVLAAARELGYVPNLAARRLKTRRSNCIAVRLATALTISRYFMALQGLRAYFEPRGYHLILFNDRSEGSAGNYLEACLNTQADGVIYISADFEGIPEEELREMRENRIPVSAIDCMETVPDVSSVTYDYYASTALRVAYLLDRGVRSFLYLGYSESQDGQEIVNVKNRERERAFRNAMEERSDGRWEIRNLVTAGSGNDSSRGLEGAITSRVLRKSSTPLLRRILAQADRETALLSAYEDVQDNITRLLYEDSLVSSDQGGLPWYDRSVGYDFPHFEVGFEAARSLYGVITGTGEVRKLSMLPKIRPADPEIF